MPVGAVSPSLCPHALARPHCPKLHWAGNVLGEKCAAASARPSLQVRDAVFLHGYNEPVLLLLHEEDPTWAGSLRTKVGQAPPPFPFPSAFVCLQGQDLFWSLPSSLLYP